MKFEVIDIDVKARKTDVLLFFVFSGQEKLEENAFSIDSELNNEISAMLKNGEIDTDFGSMTIVHTLGFIEPRRIAILSCGAVQELISEKFRNLLAETFRKLSNTKGVEAISILTSSKILDKFDDFEFGQLISEAATLGLYKFNKYKSF